MEKRPGFLWLIVATLLMSCFGAKTALAWPVPDTGQTICYDADGNVLDPCPTPEEDYYGQDASYTINPMSYTKLDANGTVLSGGAGTWAMVRDNVTGLIWEVKTDDGSIHDKDNTYTWYDSNPLTNGGYAGTPGAGTDTEDFIKAMNASNYGGYHDWRMPTIKELASIVDYSIPFPGPCINAAYFPNTQASYYWSSTTDANYTDGAWGMSFYGGYDGSCYKSDYNYVRAVRGGQAGSLGLLVINGDRTVTDASTGLMWQQDMPDNTMTWENALSTCETSNLADYTDWRLPTFRELRSLVDYSRFDPAINTTYFPDTAALIYWSSTTHAEYTDYAWYMDFYDGYDNYDSKSSDYYVRAVRGGQAGSLGNLVISSPKQASEWAIGALMPIRWNTADLGTNVKISLSRQGGKIGTFETIMASTPNDGQHDWTVAGFGSVNCVIKIEQADNAANWATEGLFVIKSPVNPAIYLLLLE
jgi:hypothetical protein